MGHPTDFQELKDELQTSINFKQWFKFNFNYADAIVNSFIAELTWFELQPLDVFFFADESELNIKNLVQYLKIPSQKAPVNDLNSHMSFSYFLDIMSIKTYKISYPAYCVFDLAYLINSGNYLECGYDHK